LTFSNRSTNHAEHYWLGQDIGVNLAPGNRIALDNISVSAVPEPTTWALLAGSLTTLVLFRRRRSA